VSFRQLLRNWGLRVVKKLPEHAADGHQIDAFAFEHYVSWGWGHLRRRGVDRQPYCAEVWRISIDVMCPFSTGSGRELPASKLRRNQNSDAYGDGAWMEFVGAGPPGEPTFFPPRKAAHIAKRSTRFLTFETC
jgi:hypothetical protein